jgi:hypothetical protein
MKFRSRGDEWTFGHNQDNSRHLKFCENTCKDDLYALYSLPNIVWVTEPRRIRLAWHVARMVEEYVHTGFL